MITMIVVGVIAGMMINSIIQSKKETGEYDNELIFYLIIGICMAISFLGGGDY